VISIVVLTHNRVHLLRKCVENVLARTSEATKEIVIWNNASSDGTAEYLGTLTDPRIRVVDHPRNIGQNAYAEAFALTTQPYMIELDDDVTDAPPSWDRTLLDAFVRLPRIGFLAANLVDDPNDEASYVMHHHYQHLYTSVEEGGIRLLKGPTGGGCTMTSRELHDRVGGFRKAADKVFWLEDEAYVADIEKLGYHAAYLQDLAVHHTGGPYYAPPSPEKQKYWDAIVRARLRKIMIKRTLLRVPLVGKLNERYALFEPPESPEDWAFNPGETGAPPGSASAPLDVSPR
jgi:GT2 family glycosyltransferase